MFLKTTRRIGVIAAAAAIGMMTSVVAVQAAEWKFAIEEIEGSVQDRYAEKFKELIEEKSGGDITVTIYPYGSLGTSAALTELVTQGAIQFANASPGHLGTLVSEVQVFSIPYLLSQNDEVNKKVLSESDVIYKTMQEDFHEKNLHLLTMYPEGDMVWTANKPIRKPEDFKNFKMRTMVSPMLVEAYEAFGASPTPMPYGEVYGGLQLKQIDGQVNPIFAIQEMKFYEVQDYLIFAGQQEFTTTVVTNYDWFTSLPQEQQDMVNETVKELEDYIFNVKREFAEKRLDMIKEAKPDINIIELTEEERAVFKERAQQAREKFIELTGDSGKAVLEALTQDIAEAEKELGS